jgi:nucleobase:cation symporter-1, NCS1 family
VTHYYLVRRLLRGRVGEGYDVVTPGRGRWLLSIPWLAGFCAYQLVNPGLVDGWAQWWTSLRESLGLVAPEWLSASVAAALVAFIATMVIGGALAARAGRPDPVT